MTTFRLVPPVNVPLRDVWPNEATAFTPWLLNNADYLARALNYELEITDSEVPVGRYSCDLVGRDLTNNSPLYIENQLECSDHSHLGQVMTYLSGLVPEFEESATVVWIASAFTSEHLEAIGFLNRVTSYRFFAVSISALSLGEETATPVMSVEVSPDGWSDARDERRPRREPGENSIRHVYEDFWSKYAEETAIPFRFRSSYGPYQRTDKPYDRTRLICHWQGGLVRVELKIDRHDKDGDSGYHFEWMERVDAYRHTIEEALGLSVERRDTTAASRLHATASAPDDWVACFTWFDETREKMLAVLTPILEEAA